MSLNLWLTTCLILSCSLGAEGDFPLLPPGDGWDVLYAPEHYTAENLHEYIDGAAELYRRYDLQEMVTATYANRADSSLTFTIDLYKLASPFCAFGVYSFYRQPDSRFAAIGVQAVVSSMNVRFWQANYYINIVSGTTDPRMALKLLEAAQALSSRLPTGPAPDELSLLPPEDQVPNSQKYIQRNYLGIDGLNHVVEARYHTAEDNWIAFVVMCGTESEQARVEKKLQYIPALLIRKASAGYNLFGVRECSSQSAAENFLRRF
jgi:hypothetical protein